MTSLALSLYLLQSSHGRRECALRTRGARGVSRASARYSVTDGDRRAVTLWVSRECCTHRAMKRLQPTEMPCRGHGMDGVHARVRVRVVRVHNFTHVVTAKEAIIVTPVIVTRRPARAVRASNFCCAAEAALQHPPCRWHGTHSAGGSSRRW